MALKEFEFGFGRGVQKVSLPEEHILDVLEGNPTPACDVKAATLECMRHPIGSEPLQEVVSKVPPFTVMTPSLLTAAQPQKLPSFMVAVPPARL